MTPIIDPMIFYWIDTINSLQVTFVFLTVVGFVAAFLTMVTSLNFYGEEDEKEKSKKLKKGAIISFIIAIVSLVTSVFIPNKETLTYMTISSVVTEDNINNVGEKAKQVIDYVFDKINGNETE